MIQCKLDRFEVVDGAIPCNEHGSSLVCHVFQMRNLVTTRADYCDVFVFPSINNELIVLCHSNSLSCKYQPIRG